MQNLKIIEHPKKEFINSYAIVSDTGGIYGGNRIHQESHELSSFSCLTRFRTRKEAESFLNGE